MRNFLKVVLNKIKNPGRLFLVCFYAVFLLVLAGTILLIVFVPAQTALHYACYCLAASGLVYFVYTAVAIVAPRGRECAIRFMLQHRFTARIYESYGFRTVVFAVAGFAVNVAYAAFQAVAGIVYSSVWNIAIAAFYLVLIALKGIVLLCDVKYRGNYKKQLGTYRACGYMFNLLTVAMAGIIVLMNRTDAHYEFAGYFIYVVAAYTFYKIVTAIIQFIRARKHSSLIVQAIRNINLVSAAYSVLVLQVSMNQSFGNRQNHLSNSITGALIALIILLVSIYMIVKSHRAEEPPQADGQ